MPTIIDAHSHLWLKQDCYVDGKRVLSLKNGRSIFMDEEVQMLPPFMIDSRNSAEVFLSNMDYAQVGAAVVVQEIIDGNQNSYLSEVQKRYPDRFFCMGAPHFSPDGTVPCALEDAKEIKKAGLKGIALPAHRLHCSLTSLMDMFLYMEKEGLILSICLADDLNQIAQMKEVIRQCPALKIAIGHFGMVTTPSFEHQILLAREGENVKIESGGITWLYNSEFYPYPSAIRSIRRAIDLVGEQALMWGSDYPRTITAITYRMSYDFISKSKELSEQEKELILGLNAKQFYSFGQLPDLPYIKNMSE